MSIQTVTGPVPAVELGATLTHEHLVMNFSHFYRAPPAHATAPLAGALRLECAGALRQYPYSSRYNLRLDDTPARDALLEDLRAFRAAGGGALVENSSHGLGRDLAFAVHAARSSGVRIVAGTGFYVAELQSSEVRATASVEAMYDLMKRELVDGCVDMPSVRAGFMGEIASVWPLHEMERRCVRAAGEVQAETGHGVSFHPHRNARAPAEIMRLYLEAGGRARKAVMSHLDRTLQTTEELLEFAELGSYLQFDLFGVECSLYQLAPELDMPSDAQRIARLRTLTQHGLTARLLISHDIHTKHRLTKFGGHGYAHILLDVVPRMRQRGISSQDIHTITHLNPAAWLMV